jgi:hypothetical protein
MQGGILVLSMDLVDYSLAEISRYIEENNAKVISSTMIEDPMDKGRIKLTLKINQLDLARIVATLERFGYRVIAHYQANRVESNDKERIDMLMRYLNI